MSESYGLYDSTDNLWLGTDSSPFTFDEKTAEIAREILLERLGWSPERLIIRPSERADVKRDEITPTKSVEEALEEISLRRMAAATGISVSRLKMIKRGAVLQSKKEDDALRAYIASP